MSLSFGLQPGSSDGRLWISLGAAGAVNLEVFFVENPHCNLSRLRESHRTSVLEHEVVRLQRLGKQTSFLPRRSVALNGYIFV